MKKETLYDIVNDILALEEIIEEQDGDITGDEDVFMEFMLESKMSLESKVENYCKLIANKNALISARKAEAARIKDLVAAEEKNVKRIKSRMVEALDLIGVSKVETVLFKVSTRNAGGVLPMKIDPKYLNTITEEWGEPVIMLTSDAKNSIREALAGGEVVTGVTLGERGRTLVIK